jgi:hypothetical protein
MYNDDDFCPIVIAKGSIKTEITDYISEAKAYGFTDKEIRDNYIEIVNYIYECNKNDYRPF